MRFIFFIPFFFISISIYGQNVSFLLGLNYGGPIPIEIQDSTVGNPGIDISGGMEYNIIISEKWIFKPGLYFSSHNTEYGQVFKKDTLYSLPNNSDIEVPTYYTAYVNGKLNINYINLHVPFKYGNNKWYNFHIGGYASYMLMGQDTGSVQVVIGEGGFFDNFKENYNNKSLLRKFDYGVLLGSEYIIFNNYKFGFKASRSFNSLYKTGDNSNTPSQKLYNTYFYLFAIYTFSTSTQ